jgi:hypothetical protein
MKGFRMTVNSACAAILASLLADLPVRAWNPPAGGPASDQAAHPITPETPLREGHGHITQDGIAVLNNDGYWFAAQQLRQWQQDLLDGVRYADVYLGNQQVFIRLCEIGFCKDVYTRDSEWRWPLAADNHYFNPDTGRGFDPGPMNELAFWSPAIPSAILGLVVIGTYLQVDIRPDLKDGYPSAVSMFSDEYQSALQAFNNSSVPISIGGRTGIPLAMFYLGWASHMVQDLTVVHHTFDDGFKNHRGYERAADGLVTAAPQANGVTNGIYAEQLPALGCDAGSRACFCTYAAQVSHDPNVLQAAENGDYSYVPTAVAFAQNLQAGLYAAFLTDVGLRPVHMSAVMAALAPL